jgi:hypothetical protein
MLKRALPAQVTASLCALSTQIDRLDQAAADLSGLNRTDMRAGDRRPGRPAHPHDLARLLGFVPVRR